MIRDWLIPLGLDYNHGYAKAPVANSEVSKKREALEKRLSNVQRFREAARIKAHRASILSTRLRKEAKEHGERLYRGLGERLQALEAPGVTEGRDFVERRKQKADVDAELETHRQRVYRVEAKSYQESNKHERYCREQRELLRTLEELTAHERVMHELDNRKDHIMTECSLSPISRCGCGIASFLPPMLMRPGIDSCPSSNYLVVCSGVRMSSRSKCALSTTGNSPVICLLSASASMNSAPACLMEERSFYMRLPRRLAETLIKSLG